jgi:hypothetical protein
MYWSDGLGGYIRRANLDGSGQVTLVSGLFRPIGPTLDLADEEKGTHLFLLGAE